MIAQEAVGVATLFLQRAHETANFADETKQSGVHVAGKLIRCGGKRSNSAAESRRLTLSSIGLPSSTLMPIVTADAVQYIVWPICRGGAYRLTVLL